MQQEQTLDKGFKISVTQRASYRRFSYAYSIDCVMYLLRRFFSAQGLTVTSEYDNEITNQFAKLKISGHIKEHKLKSLLAECRWYLTDYTGDIEADTTECNIRPMSGYQEINPEYHCIEKAWFVTNDETAWISVTGKSDIYPTYSPIGMKRNPRRCYLYLSQEQLLKDLRHHSIGTVFTIDVNKLMSLDVPPLFLYDALYRVFTLDKIPTSSVIETHSINSFKQAYDIDC